MLGIRDSSASVLARELAANPVDHEIGATIVGTPWGRCVGHAARAMSAD